MATYPFRIPQMGKPRIIFWLGILGALVLVYLIGSRWILHKAEDSLAQALAKSNLAASWENASVSPWNGIRFRKVTLREATGKKALVASTENISINAPLLQFIGIGQRNAEIHIRNSAVVLGDQEGEIPLEKVNFSMRVLPEKCVIQRAEATSGGLTADVTGTYLRRPREPRPFVSDLSAVRSVLAALDFADKDHPFRVEGTFDISPEAERVQWKANLKGQGQQLVWKNIQLSKMQADADLSSGESTIHISADTTSAHATATLTKNDWQEAPLNFRGELKDQHGSVDQFHGIYQDSLLTVENFSGSADLLHIAREIFPDRIHLPEQVSFSKFPEHQIAKIRWSWDRPSEWTMESAKITGQDISLSLPENRTLHITSFSGDVSKSPEAWKLDEVLIRALSGEFKLTGRYHNSILSESRISGKNIPLREIKQLAAPGSSSPGRGKLSFDYTGSIHPMEKTLFGTGSMTLEDAPILEVPLLDQVYQLFMAVIPGIERSRTGRFEANFTAESHIVEVRRFEAKGGSLTVSARGIIDLQKEYVSGQARGKLLGLPGLVTKPLARLLELDVGGPFDDIRVKPLGPTKLVSNAASGTVGVAVDTISEVGRVTETILREGIRLPFRQEKKEPEGEQEKKPAVRKPAHRR